MKKIVVTGATSMIGTALIEKAVAEGVEVYCIVRPDTKRMDRLVQSDLVHPIIGSLDSLKEIDGIPFNCDVLYHFAWAGTGRQDRNDARLQENNICYTLDAVELAERTGCHRFIGAGSQAEYGPVYGVINENTCCRPVLAYGMAKNAAGALSRILCESKGIEHVWGRIFSVYGPHDNDGTMLNYAIDCWNRGECAKLSSGQQMWNYIYEIDAGRMFYEMGKDSTKPGIYLVANPESIPLRKYIEILRREYGDNARTQFAESQKGTLPGLNVDMRRTIEILGFNHFVSFEDGIKKMIGRDGLSD